MMVKLISMITDVLCYMTNFLFEMNVHTYICMRLTCKEIFEKTKTIAKCFCSFKIEEYYEFDRSFFTFQKIHQIRHTTMTDFVSGKYDYSRVKELEISEDDLKTLEDAKFNFPNLRRLKIHQLYHSTIIRNMSQITLISTQIEELHIEFCYKESIEFCKHYTQLPSVVSLTLIYFDRDLRNIQIPPNLKKLYIRANIDYLLNISGNNTIEEVLIHACGNNIVIADMPNLKVIDVTCKFRHPTMRISNVPSLRKLIYPNIDDKNVVNSDIEDFTDFYNSLSHVESVSSPKFSAVRNVVYGINLDKLVDPQRIRAYTNLKKLHIDLQAYISPPIFYNLSDLPLEELCIVNYEDTIKFKLPNKLKKLKFSHITLEELNYLTKLVHLECTIRCLPPNSSIVLPDLEVCIMKFESLPFEKKRITIMDKMLNCPNIRSINLSNFIIKKGSLKDFTKLNLAVFYECSIPDVTVFDDLNANNTEISLCGCSRYSETIEEYRKKILVRPWIMKFVVDYETDESFMYRKYEH